jgi:hypothetical protein
MSTFHFAYMLNKNYTWEACESCVFGGGGGGHKKNTQIIPFFMNLART